MPLSPADGEVDIHNFAHNGGFHGKIFLQKQQGKLFIA
jgi:hypothetical protein